MTVLCVLSQKKKIMIIQKIKNLSPSLPLTAPNQKHQNPLKLKMNKNSDKNKIQKNSQVVNFTEMTSSAMPPENLINTSVQIGDFVLVKYE